MGKGYIIKWDQFRHWFENPDSSVFVAKCACSTSLCFHLAERDRGGSATTEATLPCFGGPQRWSHETNVRINCLRLMNWKALKDLQHFFPVCPQFIYCYKSWLQSEVIVNLCNEGTDGTTSFCWQRSTYGSSSVLYVSVVTFTTDLSAWKFPEDKSIYKKSFETPRRTKSTNTKFPYHTDTQQLWKMLAEFGGLKTLTALKTSESILLFTQKVGIQRDNDEKEKDGERRVKKRVRTRGQLHWFCQTMVKYYKIFY